MKEHEDDEPVVFGWAASSNIGFRGKDESGYTWGDWREMSVNEQDDAMTEFIWNELGVEIYVADENDE